MKYILRGDEFVGIQIHTRQRGFTGEVYVFDKQCSEGPIVICSGLTPEKPALYAQELKRRYKFFMTCDQLLSHRKTWTSSLLASQIDNTGCTRINNRKGFQVVFVCSIMLSQIGKLMSTVL
ncbi:unnamed protein product [Callosobruchus maculatus]|uniref:Uncharacterized protein n=1 Tax=Callosobruchus maculatus TaxID=64391 RepID=A0A653CNG2_CALMS|nr:unnamed protein product [Callosobruchus maculatus]